MSTPDLTDAVNAAAKAWYDHVQIGRRDFTPAELPTFEQINPMDQHAYRELVLPIIRAAFPHIERAVLLEVGIVP